MKVEVAVLGSPSLISLMVSIALSLSCTVELTITGVYCTGVYCTGVFWSVSWAEPVVCS